VLLTLLLGPVRGVVWLAEQLEKEAQRQLHDPALIRAQLAELDAAWSAGVLDDTEREARQDELVARLVQDRSGDG
jgi:hypothetical protein